MFWGRPKPHYFDETFCKVKRSLASWKGSSLSLAGRICLVNSVITSKLVYSFMSYLCPSSLIKRMNVFIRNFIWKGNVSDSFGVRVNWDTCCLPINLGGLGIKNLSIFNKSLQISLAWNLLSGKSVGLDFVRSQFHVAI